MTLFLRHRVFGPRAFAVILACSSILIGAARCAAQDGSRFGPNNPSGDERPATGVAPAQSHIAGEPHPGTRRWKRPGVVQPPDEQPAPSQRWWATLGSVDAESFSFSRFADLLSRLDDRGVTLSASITADVSKNFRGGADTAATPFRSLLDVNALFDLDKLLDWQDTAFFVDFQTLNGANGSLTVGDIQVFSNIDADDFARFAQFWTERTWLDERVRLKIGRVDANTEFAFVEHGLLFLNSSMGFSPTIAFMPTYPEPQESINLFVTPADWFEIRGGVYDNVAGRSIFRRFGSSSALFDDLFLIGEVGVHWNWFCPQAEYPGHVRLGGWFHHGDVQRFDGALQSGTGGGYVTVEQTFARRDLNDPADAGWFLQVGWSDADVSPIDRHVGTGVAVTGWLPHRPVDVLGLGASWARLSNAPGAGFAHRAETAVEAFYQLQIHQALSITFDLQYVRHPGGQPNRSDAFVGTLRFVLGF